MADFICEERLSSRNKLMMSDGFIAEMRPSSRHGQLRYPTLPPPLTTASSTLLAPNNSVLKLKQHEVHPDPDTNDQVLVSLLSNKSKEEYTNILTTSVIRLVHTLLTGHSVANINGAVHVTFHGTESPMEVILNESYGSKPSLSPQRAYNLEADKETGVKHGDERHSVSDYNLSVESCQFYSQFSPEPQNRDEIASVGSLSPTTDHSNNDVVMETIDGQSGDKWRCQRSPNGRSSSQETFSSIFSDNKDVVYNVAKSNSYSTASSDLKDGLSDRIQVSQEQPVPRLIQPALESQQTVSHNSVLDNNDQDAPRQTPRQAPPQAPPPAPRQAPPEALPQAPLQAPPQAPLQAPPQVPPQALPEAPRQAPFQAPQQAPQQTPPQTPQAPPQASHDDQQSGDVRERAVAMDLSSERDRPTCTGLTSSAPEDKESMETISYPDSEHHLPSASSDDTDSDVPMDLSGDCQIKRDTQAVPQELERKTKSPLTSKKTFKCKFCPYTFPDGSSLSKHAFHIHQVYMCHHCSRVFTAKNNLKRHIRIHTGLRPYKCTQCTMSFARRDDLKGHQLRHDYNKPFRCSICKKGYTDRACVKNHMSKEHGSRQMHVCPQCGESFDHEELFSKHKKSHQELIQFACDICPFIGSNNLMACKHHLLHTRKLFSCKLCNAYFADPFGYTDHIRKHKKHEAFTSYACCFCDTILPTYEQFVRHEYSHAHLKLHSCSVCDKQFRSKVLLQEHSVVHVDELNQESRTTEQPGGDNVEESKMQKDDSKSDNSVQQGEVLDLTVKKAANSLEPIEGKKAVGSSSDEQENVPINGVPRNGYAADISCSRETDHTFDYLDDFPQDYGKEKSNPKSEELSKRDRNLSYQLTADLIRRFECYRNGNGIRLSPTAKCTSPNENLPPHSSAFKRYIGKGDHRYAPYPDQSKASELATKFILARGRSAFVQASAMKDIHNSHLPFIKEQMENVSEKNGRFHVASLQGNDIFRATEEGDLKDAMCVTPSFLHANDITGDQSLPVVYGLTGAKYQRDSPDSEPHPMETYFSAMELGVVGAELFDNVADRHVPFSPGSSPNPTTVQTCDTCSQVFETFSQLESHSVLTHKRYMCEYCGKGFTSRPNRDRHVRYHTGERPYKCDLCDTAFHRGDDLKYHRTTRHPEATPFVCNHCSASFTWKRDLDRHIRHSRCKF